MAGSYLSWLTPMTTVRSSPLAGAEMMTFLAPAAKWAPAFSLSVKRPLDSTTSETPRSFHGSFDGSFSAVTPMRWPLIIRWSAPAVTSPSNVRWTESYLKRWASVFVSVMSLTETNSRLLCFWSAARSTSRPIRPNPLIPTRTAMSVILRRS